MPYFFASLKVAVAAALIGTIVGELPTGAIEGLGARMLIGSQFGEPLIMWASLFAAAILAGGLIVVVGIVERLANARMGVRA
jgi:NitT/TauT family transport system permease protein